MELKLDEQKLLGEFRRLSPEGKAELLDYAAFLLAKYSAQKSDETVAADNQCPIDKTAEKRPEAEKEPIFTE